MAGEKKRRVTRSDLAEDARKCLRSTDLLSVIEVASKLSLMNITR